MTMKFFNWMHRKLLHPSVVYSRVPQKQQPDVFNDGKDSEADEAVLLSNVLDGILAIGHSPFSLGTLGIDSPYNSLTQFEYGQKDKQDHDQEQEVKELALPIVAAKPATILKKINVEKKRDVEMVVIFELKNNNVLQNSHKEHMIEPLLKEDKEKESKRITLADLFAAADPPVENGLLGPNKKPKKTKRIACKWKHNNKVAHENKEEKPMPKISTTNSSTKQVQRVIAKVLKKKVHPEMEVGGAMKEMEKKISLLDEKANE